MQVKKHPTKLMMDKSRLYADVIKYAHDENMPSITTTIVQILGVRNEINKLIMFLLDAYFCTNEFWTNGINNNRLLSNSVHELLLIPQKSLFKNDRFKELLSIVVGCILIPKSVNNFILVDTDHTRLSRKLENVLVNKETYGPISITAPFTHLMTTDTIRLFDTMYHFMKHKNNKTSQLLCAFIYTLPRGSFESIPEMKMFKDVNIGCRADMCWYLWWFFILFASMKSDYHIDIVKYAFRLFKRAYHKKNIKYQLLQRIVFILVSHREENDQVLIDSRPMRNAFTLAFSNIKASNKKELVKEKVKEDCVYLDCVILNA
jgi:hypothetical protein